MNPLTKRTIAGFSQLGELFRTVTTNSNFSVDKEAGKFKELIAEALVKNPWFTHEFVQQAVSQWGELLTPDRLKAWLNQYNIEERPQKKVALILAGNIPMVGFHDLLAVLCTGNMALVKYSSKDDVLMRRIVQYLWNLDTHFKDNIIEVQGPLQQFDAVIATGSNNTSRYFEYYFRNVPHIIRKNRTAVAVLSGDESPEELTALGKDVLQYFGLGCRNVSKIFLPDTMEIDDVIKHWEEFSYLIDHHKYANNYHYQKSVLIMNGEKHSDFGFILAKEDENLFAPLATIFFEKYTELSEVESKLKNLEEDIQCVIGPAHLKNSIPFGTAQCPELTDYADRVDTVEFLLKT